MRLSERFRYVLFQISVANTLQYSVYRMPGFILLRFKRFQINANLYLDLPLELVWHLPQVPADAASPIFELTGANDLARFIDDLKFRCRDPRRLALFGTGSIEHSGSPYQVESDQSISIFLLDRGLY